MALLAGTSGYAYKEWKGTFYPDDLPAKGLLGHYAGLLPAVEINNTFYRMPKASVVESWAAQVPQHFRFVLKASRRITHFKRLKDAGDELQYVVETASLLGEKLGAILFQLPPNLKQDLERLERFLELLPARTPVAFEFRHESWHAEDTYRLLRARGAALCQSDDEDAPLEELVSTADLGYLRLRRRSYDESTLADWLMRIRAQKWRDSFVFFKHEDAGAGPALATHLLSLDESTRPARVRPARRARKAG